VSTSNDIEAKIRETLVYFKTGTINPDPRKWLDEDTDLKIAVAELLELYREARMGNLDKSEDTSSTQPTADDLSELFAEISKRAVITLDTDPVNKAMSIPVGKFVRLEDVRTIFNKYKGLPMESKLNEDIREVLEMFDIDVGKVIGRWNIIWHLVNAANKNRANQ
jgi:hypothetical protein